MSQQQQQQEPPKQQPGRGLKFCPETNDLLYPRENKASRRLEYYCKNCPYVELASATDQCVYVSELKHDVKEQTVVLQDVTADPTLPRTQEVTCTACGHNEAVFFSASSEQGMTLYFNCLKCSNRWRDYV